MEGRQLRDVLRGILDEHRPSFGRGGEAGSGAPRPQQHRGTHEPGHHAEACACGWYGESYTDHLAETLEVEIQRRGIHIGQIHP